MPDGPFHCELARVDRLVNIDDLHLLLSLLLKHILPPVQSQHLPQISDGSLLFVFAVFVRTVYYLSVWLFSFFCCFGEEVPVAVEFAYYFVGLISIGQGFELIAVNVEIFLSFFLYLFGAKAFEGSVAGDDSQSPPVLAVLFNIVQNGNLLKGSLVDPVDILHHIDLQQLVGSQHVEPGECWREGELFGGT